jgi:hypothetical protein
MKGRNGKKPQQKNVTGFKLGIDGKVRQIDEE